MTAYRTPKGHITAAGKQRIRELKAQGWTQQQIADELGCSRTAVIFHLRGRYKSSEKPTARKARKAKSDARKQREKAQREAAQATTPAATPRPDPRRRRAAQATPAAEQPPEPVADKGLPEWESVLGEDGELDDVHTLALRTCARLDREIGAAETTAERKQLTSLLLQAAAMAEKHRPPPETEGVVIDPAQVQEMGLRALTKLRDYAGRARAKLLADIGEHGAVEALRRAGILPTVEGPEET